MKTENTKSKQAASRSLEFKVTITLDDRGSCVEILGDEWGSCGWAAAAPSGILVKFGELLTPQLRKLVIGTGRTPGTGEQGES